LNEHNFQLFISALSIKVKF